jgi:hypothetical protein
MESEGITIPKWAKAFPVQKTVIETRRMKIALFFMGSPLPQKKTTKPRNLLDIHTFVVLIVFLINLNFTAAF